MKVTVPTFAKREMVCVLRTSKKKRDLDVTVKKERNRTQMEFVKVSNETKALQKHNKMQVIDFIIGLS